MLNEWQVAGSEPLSWSFFFSSLYGTTSKTTVGWIYISFCCVALLASALEFVCLHFLSQREKCLEQVKLGRKLGIIGLKIHKLSTVHAPNTPEKATRASFKESLQFRRSHLGSALVIFTLQIHLRKQLRKYKKDYGPRDIWIAWSINNT